MQEPIIRPAREGDIPRVGELLRQVNEVHHTIRPDLFKAGARKYRDDELRVIFRDPETPVFVCEDGGAVVGYAFCVVQIHENDNNLVDGKTLYLDDLCVDGAARGRGIGTALYRFVLDYAQRMDEALSQDDFHRAVLQDVRRRHQGRCRGVRTSEVPSHRL